MKSYNTKIQIYVLNSPSAEFFDEVTLSIDFDLNRDREPITITYSQDLKPLLKYNKNLFLDIDRAIYKVLSNA